jgi:hypothetical protein
MPTTTDEIKKARIPDLTTTFHWALVATGLRIFVKELLTDGTLNTRFHQVLYPSFSRSTASLSFSFASEVAW